MKHTPAQLWYAALYQPHNVLAYVSKGWRPILVAFGWLVLVIVTGIYVSPGLATARAVSGTELVFLHVAAIMLLFVCSALACLSPPPNINIGFLRLFVGWLVVFHIAIYPILVLGLGLILLNTAQPDSAPSDAQVIGLLLCLGWAIGTAFSYRIAVARPDNAAIAWRWAAVAIGFPSAVAIWHSPALKGTLWLMLSPFLVGFGIAQFRLGMWIWHSLTGWILRVATTRLVQRPDALARWHPITYDHVRLLPLPGTASLLNNLVRTNPDVASDWLIKRFAHNADRPTVQRFLRGIATSELAHPLFYALSLTPEGAAMLASLANTARRVDLPDQVYARLSAVRTPNRWGVELQHAMPVLLGVAPASLPATLCALLPVALIVLNARCWEDAATALRDLDLVAAADQPMADALAAIQGLCHPDNDDRHAEVLQHLAETSGEDSAWPERLMMTVAEQLRFLKTEHSIRIAGGMDGVR